MKLVYHPEFAGDVRRFRAQYAQISGRLGCRFFSEVDAALTRIKSSPTSAGHFIQIKSQWVPEFRRRNLSSFPFFILYGVLDELIVVGALIPSASDPLIWLLRFQKTATG